MKDFWICMSKKELKECLDCSKKKKVKVVFLKLEKWNTDRKGTKPEDLPENDPDGIQLHYKEVF